MRRKTFVPKPFRNAKIIKELLSDPGEYIMQKGFEMARLLENRKTDPDIVNALGCALVELSNQTSVYYYHPQVVECFFRQAVRTAMKRGKPSSQIVRIMDQIETLLATPDPAVVQDITSDYQPVDVEDPLDVVDLNCWRQSHARPLKGGAQ